MPPALRTILVCEAQVPFVQGGAEYHVRELVRQLRLEGCDAELVSLPFKWYPKAELLAHAAAWRLLDLSESNGRVVDRVIATKFPTYFARHPNKVAWLIHQHRAAYELAGTPFSDFRHTDEDVALREAIIRLDASMLGECRALFANSANTAARARRYNGLEVTPLYHPPRLAARLRPSAPGTYLLSVGRLEAVKRVDLILRALALTPPSVRLVIAGTGTCRDELERLAHGLDLDRRVEFRGSVDDDEIVALYDGALGVVFPPYDEDFGYVTLEAFLSAKPVITTTDAGGPNEFVTDQVNGRVVAPTPEALADAMADLAAGRDRAARWGAAGYDRARLVTWTGVVERLLA
jgi:glycosyltransferase involved in cell wall biosynthesis